MLIKQTLKRLPHDMYAVVSTKFTTSKIDFLFRIPRFINIYTLNTTTNKNRKLNRQSITVIHIIVWNLSRKRQYLSMSCTLVCNGTEELLSVCKRNYGWMLFPQATRLIQVISKNQTWVNFCHDHWFDTYWSRTKKLSLILLMLSIN